MLSTDRGKNSFFCKLKLNPENIEIVKETEFSGLFTNVKRDVEYLIKIRLKKDISLFLNILIENLRSKGEFTIRTAYVGSEIFFEPRKWYETHIKIKSEPLWIYWGDGGSIMVRSMTTYEHWVR